MSTPNQTFDQWCIVELFGHQRIAGRVTQQTIGGCNFVRVDVPAVAGKSAFTKLFGNGAIYAMSPVAEDVAIAVATTLRIVPVSVYEIPELRKLQDRTGPEYSDDDDRLDF